MIELDTIPGFFSERKDLLNEILGRYPRLRTAQRHHAALMGSAKRRKTRQRSAD